jgi:hypothetical protein
MLAERRRCERKGSRLMRLETYRPMLQPDGSIRQAQIRIGNSIMMMGELAGKFRPMPPSLDLYVDDTDAFC